MIKILILESFYHAIFVVDQKLLARD